MRKKLIILSIIVLTILSVRWMEPRIRSDYFDIARNLDIFATLFKEVNTHYVDEVDPNKMVAVGIEAMLESLDPYTNYIPQERLESYKTMTTGQYAGIGISVTAFNDKVVVTNVFDQFSAHEAGIKIGDELISVNNLNVKSDNIPEISEMLKGQVNSEVTVVIKRYGQPEPLRFNLKREKITIGNVPFYGMIDNNTGYIKLEEFTVGASRNVKSALLDLKKQGAQSLILDLRDNPGGLLSESINICNLFIEKGIPVVSTQGKVIEWNKDYRSLNKPTDTDIPLAILIDHGSASASEIVAGVIQDYDRGILVGRDTYGKGLVQTTRQLPFDSQLKITTAKYYIPSGRCIQSEDFGQFNHSNDDVDVDEVFKTSGGRSVISGSGIRPDIIIKNESYSPLAYALIHQGIINDFANQYFADHDKPNNPREFKLTSQDYNVFVESVKNSDFVYDSPIQLKINQVTKLDGVKSNSSIKSEINKLNSKLDQISDQELIHRKEEIIQLLNLAIIRRNFLYKGEIEYKFDHDPDIIEARNILNEPEKYQNILQ